MNNKQAQIRDIAFVLVTLVSIGITMLVAGYLYTQIDAGLSDSGLETNTSAQAYDQFSLAYNIYDSAFAFILIGLIIGLLVSSFFIPTHPIFLVINIVGFLILVFLGAVMTNLYADMIAVDGLTAVSNTYFPTVSFIMLKMPWIGAITIFLSTIIMYSKGRSEGAY